MGGSSLRDRADDLLERASVLSESSSGGRPHSSPALGSTRRRRKPRWSTPGPGAYNIDDSKKAASLGGMGRHGKGGAAYSFGTAARYDDRAKQYLGAGHGSASSMFGHQSPGATTACSLRSLPPSLPPSRPRLFANSNPNPSSPGDWLPPLPQGLRHTTRGRRPRSRASSSPRTPTVRCREACPHRRAPSTRSRTCPMAPGASPPCTRTCHIAWALAISPSMTPTLRPPAQSICRVTPPTLAAASLPSHSGEASCAVRTVYNASWRAVVAVVSVVVVIVMIMLCIDGGRRVA
jgi:hypothetical protein